MLFCSNQAVEVKSCIPWKIDHITPDQISQKAMKTDIFRSDDPSQNDAILLGQYSRVDLANSPRKRVPLTKTRILRRSTGDDDGSDYSSKNTFFRGPSVDDSYAI